MRRYETLDGLRGVAALAVVMFHLGQVRMEQNYALHGYLAVDFFFVLSGFVLAFAYEGALRDWLTVREFFLRRLIRLYPLALCGALMGLVALLLKWHTYPDKVDDFPRILASGLFNCLMLPTFFGGVISRHELFPGNGPLWSLFFEMVVNLLWARFGVQMRTWTLATFAFTSGIALVILSIHFHTVNIGFDIATFWGGLTRVCFSFPLGIIIYRLQTRIRVPSTRFGPLLAGAGLVAVLVFPWHLGTAGVPWWDIISVLIVLPAIVVLGVAQRGGGHLSRLLGDLSYPVYVLHFPVLLVVSGLHQSALSAVNVHVLSALSVALVLVLGFAAFRFYDEPVRLMLSKAMKVRMSRRAELEAERGAEAAG